MVLTRNVPLLLFMHTQLSLSLPIAFSNDLLLLVLGAVSAFLLSYLFTFGVIAGARKLGWLDRPEPGRTDKKPLPRLGGVGIFLAFVIASLIFYVHNAYQMAGPLKPDQNPETTMYWLFLIGATLIVLVHAYDDIKPLKPLVKLAAQTVAAIIIMGPFAGRFNGVLLFGFSNPFSAGVYQPGLPWYNEPVLTLLIHTPVITLAAIPAVLFTWFWMAGMMNTVNLIDGVDGLATGVVAITALCITITSWMLHQYTIAILTAIFTGAVLGFLPHNWNPAKIIMGDSGSQFLGLGLAVLSIIGGAKVGAALMVLGIPILDVAVVIINRVRRGQPPLHYDTTHLHHRLRATGLNAKQICYVFYGFTAVFGILALNLLRIYKLVGIGLVGVAMIALIAWIDYRQRQRGTPIKLGGPEPGSGGDANTPLPQVLDAATADSKDTGAMDNPASLKSETTEQREGWGNKGDGGEQLPATPPPPDSIDVRSDARLPR